MVYPPFLPEAASGNIEPRHVVVPLRTVLRRVRPITGEVTDLDHGRRVGTVQPPVGEPYELPYDVVIIGCGSVSRASRSPAWRSGGWGSSPSPRRSTSATTSSRGWTPRESIADQRARERTLTFVFVGGGGRGTRGSRRWRSSRTWPAMPAGTTGPSGGGYALGARGGGSGILPEIGAGLGEYALERLIAAGSRSTCGHASSPPRAGGCAFRTASPSRPTPWCGRPA